MIKCVPDYETVDINLDYEVKMTSEERKKIEFSLSVTKENFDTYAVLPDAMKELQGFLLSKISIL